MSRPNCFPLFIFCGLAVACQSSGQQNKDGGGFPPGREVPKYVMDELPGETDTLLRSPHFLFLGHGQMDTLEVATLAANAEGVFAKIAAFAGGNLKKQPIVWHLYPSIETKGLLLQNSAPCQVNFQSNEVFYVLNEVYGDHYFGGQNELILRQLLGTHAAAPLEKGLALHFAPNWQGLGFGPWAARLKNANSLPPLSELFEVERWETCSGPIFQVAAASFTGFLLEKWGEKLFLEKYPDWHPTRGELQDLQAEWGNFLQKQGSGFGPLAQKMASLPTLKGFNFAHEGYRVYNGYGSRKADQALQHLVDLGSNAVAIVPYSFMKNAGDPTHIPVVRHTGAENDESVIQSAESAQALGLAVVLKPQIWMGGGQWPGDIKMSSAPEWEQFFACYNHWIVHYAMLAELYGWESLCIGTEMVQTTLEREADWREIIRNIRQVYSGQITYAANWGDEFEKLKFWDELDYIGLNCYYPLSQKDNATDRELKKGFAGVVSKIENVYVRYHKPVVFTEIGFPNIVSPWIKPHEDWGEFELNNEHQRRCYEVVFEAIEGKPWCGGILWWKYPSDLDHQGGLGVGFTPYNKPAEATVEKWFKGSD